MLKKRQELADAHMRGILAGVKLGAKVAREMVQSGWKDVDKFEKEVLRRVRTGKR